MNMPRAATAFLKRKPRSSGVDCGAVLHAMPDAVLVIDSGAIIRYANLRAEEFFQASAAILVGTKLNQLLPPDSTLFSLVNQVWATGASLAEHGVSLESPRIGSRLVTLQVSPINEQPNLVLISLRLRSFADKLDRQLTQRHAARSVSAMGAMLAHEVKNPLSSIRGAAQLLDQNADPGDRELTRLICEETDRIKLLIERMEAFSDDHALERGPVNIHAVLERVRKAAQTGFARNVTFVERYDPSLPAVLGDRDRLIQVFMNLVKNAAEAVPAAGGEIVLATAYEQGARLAVPATGRRVHLPLIVTVQDNGPGIPEELQAHLFDPFLTTKRNGTGLGLALVSKILSDHGAVIEFESRPRRTVFRVSLPMFDESAAREGELFMVGETAL
jgi:two-component system nitrogen regulation sensor histidine kinase GlnL